MNSISPLPCPNPLPNFSTGKPPPLPHPRRLLAIPSSTLSTPSSLIIDSLSLLGITTPLLPRLLARRPDLLTSPHTHPFLSFLAHSLPAVSPHKLHRLLIATPPDQLPRFPTTISLLLSHGFPQDQLSHLFNNVDARKLFFQMPLTQIQDTIHFLAPYGWPDLVVRRPMLLNLDLEEQLMPRVEYISNLGRGDDLATAKIIHKLPAVLAYTVEHYHSHIMFWRSVGITDEQVFRIAVVYPNVFSVSRDNKLRPRVEFLLECGLGAEEIFKFLIKAPLFLSLSLEGNLSKKLGLLVKLGYRYRTREMAMAVGAVTRTSCENMQAVIGVFFDYGLSCEDVLAMSKKHPQVLQYGSDSLDKKIEFLVDGMERDVGELLVFPAFLGYKLDDRIKKRYEAKMKTRGKGMSLNKLLSVSTKKFLLPDEKLLARNVVKL